MLRKNYFILLSTIGVVLLSTLFASAQIVNITGRVEVVKEGGERAAAANALVEIYRIGISSANRSDTTDKDGYFKFLGVPPGSQYLLAVSGEGLEPVIVTISGGMENQVVTVNPGNGTRYTEEQVRASMSNTGTGELTEEQKKELEELEKKRAEIDAKNKRAEQFNSIVNRVVEDGKKAFEAKNYDLAIVTYTEGYEAGKDFLGSAPGFLNNIGVSYKARAIENYNSSVKSSDAAMKAELKEKAEKDFEAALVAFAKSLNLLMTGNADGVNPQTLKAAKVKAVTDGQSVVELMTRTQLVTDAVKDDAKLITAEYVKTESDKDKKLKAQLDLGIYLTRAFDYDGAVEVYRNALEMDSKNPDALSGLGVSLYLASEVNGDAAQKQEGLNYMQYYLDNAPKDHSFRESIEGIVEELKAQKMKPQKISMK